MNPCERLRRHLLKHGQEGLMEDAQLSQHLAACADCRNLLDAWLRIPGLLDSLPEREPDAGLVGRTRALIHEREAEPAGPAGLPRLPASLGAAAVLLAAFGLSWQLMDTEAPSPVSPAFKEEYELSESHRPTAAEQELKAADEPLGPESMGHVEVTTDPLEPTDYSDPRQEEPAEIDRVGVSGARVDVTELGAGLADDSQLRGNKPDIQMRLKQRNQLEGLSKMVPVTEEPESSVEPDGDRANQVEMAQRKKPAAPMSSDKFSRLEILREKGASEKEKANVPADFEGNEAFYWNMVEDEESRARHQAERAPLKAGLADKTEAGDYAGNDRSGQQSRDVNFFQNGKDVPDNRLEGQSRLEDEDMARDYRFAPSEEAIAAAPPAIAGGFGLLDRYQASESLVFQPASGYWANTHVPGDPEIRLLRARLAAWGPATLKNVPHLEAQVRPVAQPFDAPADNALSLSLMSDAAAVDGATRLRLQVGIRGIEHRRGQRPAMNLAMVVDLPEDADDGTRIAARALLEALLAGKQAGDRFSLVLGGLVVAPEEFRFGPLQEARQALLSAEHPSAGPKPDLLSSLRTAAEQVARNDDPGRPLGSSSILLVSATGLDDVDALSALVHEQAKAGITTSVVPLGGQSQSGDVEKLVLAGLGSRRILEEPGQARQLVEAELHAASRAVARAARLSIRLAPGVRLVGVVGSERLDEVHAQRVRDIETSMDRRLSANLGIQADRGEDEDGIQIVIPSIHSGDDVAVLVDLVVDRPGDIATVTLRYKDLVYLRNGSLRGQLRLPGGDAEPGPAQHAVLKSLLAHHFSRAAADAADALGRGDHVAAGTILAVMRDGIRDTRKRVPALAQDPDLLRDEKILDEYIALLATPGAGAYQPEMADSLRYAAWAKTHRPPTEWKP